jgi:hypothetical protein
LSDEFVGATGRGQESDLLYKPSAFSQIETFPDQIRYMGYQKLAARLAKSPVRFVK